MGQVGFDCLLRYFAAVACLAARFTPGCPRGSGGRSARLTRSWRGRCLRPRPVQRNSEATTDMANTPKKMKDPTEAALSAIQDALQVRDVDKPAESQATPMEAPVHPDEGASDAPWPGLRSKQPGDAGFYD